MIQIKQVETENDIQNVQGLMHEYFEWLKRDVDKVDDLSVMPAFTDLDNEFSNLPGIYSPPEGCLLLAIYETEAAGCGALKKINDQVCELKRMYVRPSLRGKGIG